jgi:predicted nucleotidyltransferase
MVKKSILTDTPKNLIKKYYRVLEEDGISVEKIILFGSWAKGKPKYYSDLDVCVVSKAFGKNGYEESVRLAQLTSKVDSMIEPHAYHPDDLKEKWDSLAHEIRKHGKVFKFK